MGIPIITYKVDPLGGPIFPPGRAFVDEYNSYCSHLWCALRQRGVVVLDFDDSEYAVLESDLHAFGDFFASSEAVKQAAISSVPGEGFSRPAGKELLAFRLGLSMKPADRLHAKACRWLDGLARSVLRDLCRSKELGLHPAVLSGLLEDGPLLRSEPSASVLRASCYSADAPASSLAFMPHHDRGLLTLVSSAQVSGLQVLLAHGGGGEGADSEWVDVPLGPGRVAVLVGYSLSYALGGMLQPVLHRVAAGARRISLAYELAARPGARVCPEDILSGAACRPEGPPGEPLYVSQLMDKFNRSHPVSINGVPRVAVTQAHEPAGRDGSWGGGLMAALPGAVLAAARNTCVAGTAVACALPAGEGQATAVVPAPTRLGVTSRVAPLPSADDAAAAGPSNGQGSGGPRREAPDASQDSAEERPAKAPRLEGPAGPEAPGYGGGGRKRMGQEGGSMPAPVTLALPAAGGSAPDATTPEPRRATGRPAAGQPGLARTPGQELSPRSPALDGFIRIKLQDACCSEVLFEVKPATRMGKVFKAYARKKGLEPHTLRYLYEGDVLSSSITAHDAGLEDGDVVYVMHMQAGS